MEGDKPVANPYHGGSRAGAGKPPELQHQIVEARKLAKQLQIAGRTGIKRLGVELPSLIEQAIEIAKTGDEKMIRYLLDLFFRVVRLEDGEEEKPISQLINNLKVQLNVTTRTEAAREVEAEWREVSKEWRQADDSGRRDV